MSPENGREAKAATAALTKLLGDGAATIRKKAAKVLLRTQKACGLKQGGLRF